MTFHLILSGSDLLLLAPEIFLTLWLCVTLGVDCACSRIRHETLAYLGLGGVIVTLLMLIGFDVAGVRGSLLHETFVLDGVAIFFKIFVLTATALVLLMSIDTVRGFRFFRGEYYVLVMMAALGMMFMASAHDLLSVFVTLEFSTFGFYILVAYLRDDRKSGEAALKFFILGVFVAGLLAYGISLVYGETGTMVFTDIASAPGSYGLAIGFIMIFAALGFKIGAVPFHSWIPDTYQGAPTPVTAFLSIAPKGAAMVILIRMFYVALATFKPMWVLLFVLASIISMTYGNIVAIAQTNIKRLLAYSGIAQIGNVMIGLAAGTKRGTDAILFYLLTYLFANLGAFAVVIGVSRHIKSDELDDYNGLNRRSPFLAAAMLLFLLSLAGVPPLAGFIGKLYIFVAAMEQELYTLLIVGLVNIVISMYYYLIVVKKMYINEPVDPAPLTVSPPLKTAIAISIVGTLLLGLSPGPFIDWAVSATLMFSDIAAPIPGAHALALPAGG